MTDSNHAYTTSREKVKRGSVVATTPKLARSLLEMLAMGNLKGENCVACPELVRSDSRNSGRRAALWLLGSDYISVCNPDLPSVHVTEAGFAWLGVVQKMDPNEV